MPVTTASSWPTPSSSSAWTATASWSSGTRCSPRTRPATGPPTAMRSATVSPASTSSTSATGPPPADGTRSRRRPPSRTTWLRARAPATSRPTSGSPESRSRHGWTGRRRADPPVERTVVRARVLIRPKEGILDPQGVAVERALPALGFAGAANVHVGRLVELDVDDPGRVGEMCERLLANPLIEDHDIEWPEANRQDQDAGLDAPRRQP